MASLELFIGVYLSSGLYNAII